MRRNRSPSAASGSPYRALSHLQAAAGVIRSFDVDTNPSRPVRPSPLTASGIRDMPLELFDRIRNFPLFASAPDDFLVAILRHLRPQVHATHDHVIREGDAARAMYWLVRGIVAVTSRDGEAVYAELKPGAFFGEIGVLMNIPRTATIVARTKCLLVVLLKEDLLAELPRYPVMERAIMHEAQERLTVLQKKKNHGEAASAANQTSAAGQQSEQAPGGQMARADGDGTGPAGGSSSRAGGNQSGAKASVNTRKRKSPSPGVAAAEDPAAGGSFLGSTTAPAPAPAPAPAAGDVEVRRDIDPFLSVDMENLRNRRRNSLAPPPGTDGAGAAATTAPFESSPMRNSVTAADVERMGVEEEAAAAEAVAMTPTTTTTTTAPAPAPAAAATTTAAPAPSSTTSAATTTPVAKTPIEGSEPEREPKLPSSPSAEAEPDQDRLPAKRQRTLAHRPPLVPAYDRHDPGLINALLVAVFQTLELPVLLRARAVCSRWQDLATNSPRLCRHVVLGPYNRSVTDQAVTDVLAPFFGTRPVSIDISDCFHLTDVGFSALWHICGQNVRRWSMRSVWDVSPLQILEMADHASGRLEELDWSNCRKIGDNLLARVVGWVVPGPSSASRTLTSSQLQPQPQYQPVQPQYQAAYQSPHQPAPQLQTGPLFQPQPQYQSQYQAPAQTQATPTPTPTPWEQFQQSQHNTTMHQMREQQHNRRWNPQVPHHPGSASSGRGGRGGRPPPARPITARPPQPVTVRPPQPGTVIGCPRLQHLNLSYCKHITDRSMAHLAVHASRRLRSLILTRCTSITDLGFAKWAPYHFPLLTRLSLADCTYLTDNAIISLVNAAKNLTILDLSFCCALSETATQVVALGLPRLRELRLAFCGSAVSDASLSGVALHLNDLELISVRGCVRVTGAGVESLVGGCSLLQTLDVSQCRALEPWLRAGGVARWGYDDRASAPPQGTMVNGQTHGAGPTGPQVPAHSAAAEPEEEEDENEAGVSPPGPAAAGSGPGSTTAGPGPRRPRTPVRFILNKRDEDLR